MSNTPETVLPLLQNESPHSFNLNFCSLTIWVLISLYFYDILSIYLPTTFKGNLQKYEKKVLAKSIISLKIFFKDIWRIVFKPIQHSFFSKQNFILIKYFLKPSHPNGSIAITCYIHILDAIFIKQYFESNLAQLCKRFLNKAFKEIPKLQCN